MASDRLYTKYTYGFYAKMGLKLQIAYSMDSVGLISSGITAFPRTQWNFTFYDLDFSKRPIFSC